MTTQSKNIKKFFVEGKHARITRIIGFCFTIFGGLALLFVSPTSVLSNLATEIFGIGLTVLIIDNFNEQKATRELKASLVRDLGSGTNSFVKRAFRELKYYSEEYDQDWLYDGSLDRHKYLHADWSKVILRQNVDRKSGWRPRIRNANFLNVIFEKAVLYDVDFSGSWFLNSHFNDTYLSGTIFRGCKFGGADFRGATLNRVDFTCSSVSPKQINQADSIFNITLPDGQILMDKSQPILLDDPKHYKCNEDVEGFDRPSG